MAHDPALRAEAVRLATEVGSSEAARRLGLPTGTVASWFSRSGAASMRNAQTAAAVEARKLTRQQRIARLAEKLLDEAEVEISRLRQPMTVHKVVPGRGIESFEAEPEPSDRRAIATTAAILIDKSQLLAGEATSRSEVRDATKAREEIDDLRERLNRRLRIAS